ncbi:DUF4041 domain-containing protein [Brachybacterium huguangmaarense]|uniref:DUF4041 domain-containing protein n=1 Tax=Brachybacterium huguangmaarense TaxID=1652028 RepID=A0ABY6FY03_9MICO|nr:DUF4041 domain-containing protein [Brachybacterium huguangmaarense]UYG15803.1 DUF4041 domain-containing protein [Brachybacterium huguangmaarense]
MMAEQPINSGPKLGIFERLSKGQKLIDQQHAELLNRQAEAHRLNMLIDELRGEVQELRSRNEAGSAAWRELRSFVDSHGGDEILANETALKKSEDDLAIARNAAIVTIQSLAEKRSEISSELAHLQRDLRVEEIGGLRDEHPAGDSVVLQGELRSLKASISEAVKGGQAVKSVDAISIEGRTVTQRRKIAKDIRSLMLRSFNAEADAVISAATARNEDASTEKLYRVADQLQRLAGAVDGKVAEDYIGLKVRELRLAVAHEKAKALERELEKERRAELREQAKAERELEAERGRLAKEMSHYENVRGALEAKGDVEAVARMDEKIAEIQHGIEDVEQRAANIRAGYVYVISNLGAFGPDVVKIGLTRRLDPMDRVRELGDASVPFGFDVHALFFSDDAVAVEAELHRRFAAARVNRVNLRREFFRATPAQVREQLRDITGALIEFRENPDAAQFFESQRLASVGTTSAARLDYEPVGDGLGDDE